MTATSVTHYADEGCGISISETSDGFEIAPVPTLCQTGSAGDLMTWFWDGVTCPACLKASTDSLGREP